MSLVEIIEHNEVIYTILDKPPPSPPPTPRYESKLEKELKATKQPQTRRTFGYPTKTIEDPKKFLKKGHGICQPVKKSDHKCLPGHLPPVPKHSAVPKPSDKKPVNFKVKNIMKAIKSKAKPPEPRLVDTRDGHRKRIKGSGEVPEYCLRPDFGRLPAYLERRNERIRKQMERLRLEEEHRESLCKMISEEERAKLLNDLKTNWALMQKQFLQLPMLIDTVPKINRKVKMEKELRQIEKDIELVERNPYIYVYDPSQN